MATKVDNTFGYVYMIENLINGRQYIGAKFGHPTSIEEYQGSSETLNIDIDEYGIENFKKTILVPDVTTDDNYLDELESFMIHNFKTHISDGGYNIERSGGRCIKHTTESRKRMSESLTGKKFSEERRHKMSLRFRGLPSPKKGTKLTPLHRRRTGKEFIIISPMHVIFLPSNILEFTKYHIISYGLLYENKNRIVERASFNKPTYGSMNTIGWMQCTRDYAIDNNYVSEDILNGKI